MTTMKKKLLWGAGTVILVAGVGFWIYEQNQPGPYDDLARCLEDKGVIFYGAFWCLHCQNQKAMFGRSAENLPYVECSLPSGQGQTQVCVDEGIQSYPTWEFPGGSRMTGELTPEHLAELAGCELPQ